MPFVPLACKPSGAGGFFGLKQQDKQQDKRTRQISMEQKILDKGRTLRIPLADLSTAISAATSLWGISEIICSMLPIFTATTVGYGMNYLMPRHKTWVLSRLAIEMTEMPKSYDRFVVETLGARVP